MKNIVVWIYSEYCIIANSDDKTYSTFNCLTQNFTPYMYDLDVVKVVKTSETYHAILDCLLITNYTHTDMKHFDEFIVRPYSDFI